MYGPLCILLATAFATSDAKPGDVGTPEYEKAAQLVKQLGDAKFAVREAAGKQLVEMEFGAVPALKEGTKSNDEEIRVRCESLLPKAKAAGWNRRSVPYLADADGKKAHELPLLAEWEKLTGKPDVATRKLFAEVVGRNGEFLSEAALERKKAQDICAARCKALIEAVKSKKGQSRAEIADVTAVLLLDSLPKSPLNMRSPPSLIELLKNSAATDTLGNAEAGQAFRRLLVGWVTSQPPLSSSSAYARFADLARKTPFPEAVPVLVKLAQSKRPEALSEHLLAIEALGAIGGKEAAAALAEVVPRGKSLLSFGIEDYREGDSALAASLKMHGKKPEDYGMVATGALVPVSGWNETVAFSVYGFRDADSRAKAVARWKEDVVNKKDPKEGK
jgi:hypothetical protein